ncbi:MAG: hypothetical protein QOK25_2325 [Thermoleophilaceae bacterium]|jgi:hypothetical protein|nr:hypothetical protein [Thermoleophilaceae bacterium]
MGGRVVMLAVVGAVVAVFAASVPEIKRYLKIRGM